MLVDSGSLSLVLFSFVVSSLVVTTCCAVLTAWRTQDARLERMCWTVARRAGVLLGGIGVVVCLALWWEATSGVVRTRDLLELLAPVSALSVVVAVGRSVRGLVAG